MVSTLNDSSSRTTELACSFHYPKRVVDRAIGLFQQGTPEMDGVPGVTQVSYELRCQVHSKPPSQICCPLIATLVPYPLGGQLYVQILRWKSVRVLLVPFSLQSLLRRCDTRAAPDPRFACAGSPLREPRQQYPREGDVAASRARRCFRRTQRLDAHPLGFYLCAVLQDRSFPELCRQSAG